jgi:cytochrome P450
MAEIARQFTTLVSDLLRHRRQGHDQLEDDVTTGLMRAHANRTPFTDEEIASVLRNWTVGEVGSLSAAVGILARHLSLDLSLQQRLRADESLLPAAIDEILRICGPLVASRRTATRDVEVGGRLIRAGDRVSLMWVSANRDEHVFEAPTEVRLDRDPRLSLLYGKGIHVCPGAPLARLELRVVVEELLRRTARIELDATRPLRKAVYPQNGYASLWLQLSR